MERLAIVPSGPLASTKVGHPHHLMSLLCRAVSWLRWICLSRIDQAEKAIRQIKNLNSNLGE